MDIQEANGIYVQNSETDAILKHMENFISLVGRLQGTARELEVSQPRLLVGINTESRQMEVEWSSFRDPEKYIQEFDDLIKRIHEEYENSQRLILEFKQKMNQLLNSSTTGS